MDRPADPSPARAEHAQHGEIALGMPCGVGHRLPDGQQRQQPVQPGEDEGDRGDPSEVSNRRRCEGFEDALRGQFGKCRFDECLGVIAAP